MLTIPAHDGRPITSCTARYHVLSTTLSKIDLVGRLIIPAQARRALDLDYGGPVVLTLVDGELRVRSVATAMAALQAQASSYLAGDDASVATEQAT